MEHVGHRERIRQRYISQGLDGFQPHEILELLLTYAIPRVDTNPIAHRLIARFGSLHRVMQAHPQELMQVEGVGQNAATLLSMMVPLFRCYQQDALRPCVKMENFQDLSFYCTNLFLGETEEKVYLLCLDGQLRLLATELIAHGSPDQVQLMPRKIVQTLMRHQALGAVLAHNHPSGSCFPSQADVTITQTIHALLQGMDIRLYDHILIAENKSYSFQRHGYLGNEQPQRQTDAQRRE